MPHEPDAFAQFILIGGDAGMGHFFYPHPVPVTETQKHSAYPGCYALSKVLEEVMLEQYYIQYDLNGCCLRAPWIMEKDDFKYSSPSARTCSAGRAGAIWSAPRQADEYVRRDAVPVMLDRRRHGRCSAISSTSTTWSTRSWPRIDHPKARQQTSTSAWTSRSITRSWASYLASTRGCRRWRCATPYHSTWLDNTKAKFLLGWRPRYDLARLIDAAWDYQRAADDPRSIWYPG